MDAKMTARNGSAERHGDLKVVLEASRAGCPVSRALAGIPEIVLTAKLM
jgi:hypothetical protein